MGGIHGVAEHLIVGADVQIAIFAEHEGVGSKGDAPELVGRLPVVDEGRLVGIVTRTPALACAAKVQTEESGSELK